MEKASKIWMNGKFVDWDNAKIHVLSHVVHYGSSIFEGLRCYETPKGPAVFRLEPHVERMFDSCKIYRMEIPFSRSEISDAVLATITTNGFNSCYIRPIVYRGYGELGVNPAGCPIDVAIAVYPWGKYLGKDAMEKGVDVCVSSWNRMAPNTFPAMAKSGANYMNSQLIKMEAIADGYSEGIALEVGGRISEGSGENIFLVKNGELFTPPKSSSVLPGITRDSVIVLASDMGLAVREEPIPREMLYIADEVFFSGTAAEVSPINSVDKIVVGKGGRGPITAKIQEAFFGIVTGKSKDKYGWLTYAGAPNHAQATK